MSQQDPLIVIPDIDYHVFDMLQAFNSRLPSELWPDL